MRVPVALFIYNRPDFARRIMATIATAKPQRLLLVADGPRDRSDVARCRQARAVAEMIDWDCEVIRNFAECNLGCRLRIASGLDWVFEGCEEAIILEDDTLPDPSFFPYCAELLERYRDDPRVMMVAGQSFSERFWPERTSYHFSRFPLIWCWATWKRAWRHYDVELKRWPELRDSGWLDRLLQDPGLAEQWRLNFDQVTRREVDTWDYQWTMACWLQGGLVAVPKVNLVSNVGFGEDATHTQKSHSYLANLRRGSLGFPLRHPTRVESNPRRDRLASRRMRGFSSRTWVAWLLMRCSPYVPRSIKGGLRKILLP